ncbi:putative immunity/bacteriocin fusion bifunctional protein [Bacillus altitudinis]|uniref:putative immunity/bacteriocin fusion bifunctional protein n=1 Tax=Bacillus altitudinis TaxID=293387 RepID=UPI003457D7D1
MKLFTKLLVSVCILTLTFSNTLIANAIEKKELNILEEQKKLLKDDNITPSIMTEKDLKILKNAEKQVKEIADLRNNLKKENFDEFSLEKDIPQIKYTTETDEGNAFVYVSNKVYKNKKTKEIIVTTSIYDNYSDKIVQFVAEKTKDNGKTREYIMNYKDYDTSKITKKDNKDEEKASTSKGFKWNGKSFACSSAGLLACAQICMVYAFMGPVAASVCGGACGVAFAAVCSTT